MTTTSTELVGAQRPRLSHLLPQVSNRAREVLALGALLGVTLDEWQRWTLRHITGTREDGKWAALECDLEVPRQNGKTGQIELLIIWHLFFVPESRKIIYSAHEFKTTREIFDRVEDLISKVPALRSQVKINRSSDNLSIRMLNRSSRIQFLSRSRRAARGFSADLLVLDEAFALKTEMMAAVMPTLSARTMTGNPQLIYLSSAGLLDSDFLNGLRERALGEDPGRLFFAEWSTPDDADSEDPTAWATANPALGIRISAEFVADELRSFRSDPTLGETAWRRERLGIREKVGGETLFDIDAWDALADPTQEPTPIMAFAVDVPPTRDSASITMVSLLENGDVYMELVDRREGTSWVPERITQLAARWNPVAVVCDEYSAAGTLLSPPNAHGIRHIGRVRTMQIQIRDYAAGCGELYDLVTREPDDDGPTLVHIGQRELHDAVAVAKKKMRGETAWTLSRKDVLIDISPLVAGVHALVGLRKRADRRKAAQTAPGMTVLA